VRRLARHFCSLLSRPEKHWPVSTPIAFPACSTREAERTFTQSELGFGIRQQYLIKCVCLLRQRRHVSDTLSLSVRQLLVNQTRKPIRSSKIGEYSTIAFGFARGFDPKMSEPWVIIDELGRMVSLEGEAHR
jgi:hypothetical protein